MTESRVSQIDGAFESFYCRLRVDERLDLTELILNHAVDFRFGAIHSVSNPVMAQALAGNIPVVTSDEKFGLYQRLKIIW